MGSFAITYDDFSGGHYMGNKAASLPSNTWFGTNATLSPKGELIPGAAGLVATFAPPTTDAIPYLRGSWIRSDIIYTIVNWWDATTLTDSSELLTVDYNPKYGTTTSREPLVANVMADGVFIYNAGADEFYYPGDGGSGPSLYSYDPVNQLEGLVCSIPFTSKVISYKYRLLGYSNNTLYYSDTTKTSFGATDYYEFDGLIKTVIPRSNDLVVITENGVYSVTGVLGSSVNIQLIAPRNELLPGMEVAQASGRAIIFPGIELDFTNYWYTDCRLYQMLGASTEEIARINMDDANAGPANKFTFGLEEAGQPVIDVSNGAVFVRHNDSSWVRMYRTRANTTEIDGRIAQPTGRRASITASVVANSSPVANVEVYAFKHKNGYPSPNIDDTHSYPYIGTPASATVQLAEYWHQKPMTVREMLVEVVYDDYQDYPLELSGNASITASIKPIGAVDYGVNDTSGLSSTAQTYTTALSDVNANQSRVLHRFRTDDAIKAYGFYPQITWQGCRIRRVIAVCED